MDDGLPRGWTSINGIVGPGERVADFAARGQPVRGMCRSLGCFRNIDLDARVRRGARGIAVQLASDAPGGI